MINIINNKILGPITHKFYVLHINFIFEADICDSIILYFVTSYLIMNLFIFLRYKMLYNIIYNIYCKLGLVQII